MTEAREAPPFGALLRHWREACGLSQGRLGERAEVSTRHISFLENGRSAPSREMVLVLANALDLPLRERNTLLGTAGFAPVYRESGLESPAMASVRRALDHVLERQEPYGAAVLDRGWNVLRMNAGATRMMGYWLDPADTPPIALQNVQHALFHPKGLRPWIVDWDALASVLLMRLYRETFEPGGDESHALLEALLDYPDVPRSWASLDPSAPQEVLLPVHLRRGDLDVRLFTMLTTLGTPLDVTAQELKIESYFPADDATEAWVQSLTGP